MTKRQIYLNEYNMPTGNTFYLPYSSGLLQAYAQQLDIINDNYIFKPILFRRDIVNNLVKKYHNPDIVGFSLSVWNYNLSLAVAKQIKKRFPHSYIMCGGPSAPLNSIEFFKNHPYIDLIIYKEGERLFREVLIQQLNSKILPQHTTIFKVDPIKDLDIFPSPYVNNIYKELIQDNSDIQFKAIVETNRGCPFKCSYCFWGVSVGQKKIGFHSSEYIRKDAEWISKQKIEYVFCADANFGMFRQDIQTAQTYKKIKQKCKYPKKFRVCYGKNTTDNIFQTASILSNANLAKNVSLSVQTTTNEVLQNVGRKNIKSSVFKKLLQQYIDANIPTYTEVILGLPGETYHSYLNSLQQIIESVKHNHIFIYHCIVLPNTTLNEKRYRQEYGIKTVNVPLAEVHGTIRDKRLEQEFEEIIIGTNTMPTEDWVQCAVISWVVQVFHSFKIGYDIVDYLAKTYDIKHIDFYKFLIYDTNLQIIYNFINKAYDITNGNSRCCSIPIYGNIYYDPEEITFLDIIRTKTDFYQRLHNIIQDFLQTKGLKKDSYIRILCNKQMDKLPNIENFSSLEEFATQTILYGRKSS